MRKIRWVHPDFKKEFAMAIDLAHVISILNNGKEWNLTLTTGQRIQMISEGEDYDNFVNECQIAKSKREI